MPKGARMLRILFLNPPVSKKMRQLRTVTFFAVIFMLAFSFFYNRLPSVFSPEMLLYYLELPTDPFNLTLIAMVVISSLYILLYARKSQQYETLYSVLSSSKDAYFLLTSKGQKMFSNQAFDRLVHQPKAHPFEQLKIYFDSQSLDNFIVNAQISLKEKKEPQDCCLAAKNGRWYHLRVTPISPETFTTLWALEDITESQQRAEESEQRLRRLFAYLDAGSLGFFSMDETHRLIYVNDIFAKWLGVPKEDLLGQDLERYADNPDAAASIRNFENTDTVVHLKSAKGGLFQALIYRRTILDGTTTRYMGAVRNLSHENTPGGSPYLGNFRNLFEEAPVGVVLLDIGGTIQDCNQTFRAMVGDKDTNLVGMSFGDLIDANQRTAVLEQLRESSHHSGDPIEVTLHDKHDLIASLYVRKIEDQGKGPCLLLHFIDMTEQKKLQLQVMQSLKMQAVGKLAGGIAHDFNNLLTAMLGFCDLLLQRHSPGDHSFTDIMQIKQNANRAANLVSQLLAFSRQQTLQPRALHITDCLAELASLIRRLIGSNMELKMIHGQNLWGVKADQGQLEQVIINLAVNARDAMPQGGILRMETRNVTLDTPLTQGQETVPPGDYVCLEIADTGHGIPEEHLAHIFDPFFTTKKVGEGTGLGLSTVYGIIKQTHGFIQVNSTKDHGTTFSIYLPRNGTEAVVPQAQPLLEQSSAAQDLTGTSTILLVEDEEAVRMFCVRALKDKGYHVVEAHDGEDALEKAKNLGGKIDLMVTDVVMPGMNGPTLTHHIKEIFPHISVIFISGYAEDTFRQDLDQNMDIHFLSKPFNFKQLVAKVHEVLEARQHAA